MKQIDLHILKLGWPDGSGFRPPEVLNECVVLIGAKTCRIPWEEDHFGTRKWDQFQTQKWGQFQTQWQPQPYNCPFEKRATAMYYLFFAHTAPPRLQIHERMARRHRSKKQTKQTWHHRERQSTKNGTAPPHRQTSKEYKLRLWETYREIDKEKSAEEERYRRYR